MDLSYNRLSGTIPSEFTQLRNLKSAFLNENRLIGTLPQGLKEISSLQDLWVDHNSLAGTIPEDLGDLSSLSKLNLISNITNIEMCYTQTHDLFLPKIINI